MPTILNHVNMQLQSLSKLKDEGIKIYSSQTITSINQSEINRLPTQVNELIGNSSTHCPEIWGAELETLPQTKGAYFQGVDGFEAVIRSWTLDRHHNPAKLNNFCVAVSDLFKSDLIIDNHLPNKLDTGLNAFFNKNQNFRNVLTLYYVATVAQDKALYKNITLQDMKLDSDETINSLNLNKEITNWYNSNQKSILNLLIQRDASALNSIAEIALPVDIKKFSEGYAEHYALPGKLEKLDYNDATVFGENQVRERDRADQTTSRVGFGDAGHPFQNMKNAKMSWMRFILTVLMVVFTVLAIAAVLMLLVVPSLF